MKKFYIGYGHSSIGDCGTTTVFIEGVSIIAAKAIQNTPLYSGQESSTRFIEFSNQAEKLKSILDSNYPDFDYPDDLIPRYYEFYQEVFKTMRLEKAKMLGVDYETADANLKRSINAWAFDVGRGFLPSGTPTQLSFHGSLRELRKHFMALTKHPFDEIVGIARTVLSKLYLLYPNSFKADDINPIRSSSEETTEFVDSYILELAQLKPDHLVADNGDNKHTNDLRYNMMVNHNESYVNGNICVMSKVGPKALDYGSWRDLQRHRNGYCAPTIPFIGSNDPVSLLTDWYYNHLPAHLVDKWLKIVDDISEVEFINNDSIDCNVVSYLLPLGCPVATVVAYNTKQWDYIFDLRLRDTVHPSLVKYLSDVIFAMNDAGIHYFYNKYKDRINSLLEDKDNVISLKRGSQTILNDGKAISD